MYKKLYGSLKTITLLKFQSNLLLGKNLAMPAAGKAIASYTKALEFRNGKSFRRVTEED